MADKPDIIPLIDDGGHYCGWVAKGEWDKETMVAQIRWQWDETFVFCNYCSIKTGTFRWIPESPALDLPWKQRLEPSKPGRGAFVATVIRLIWRLVGHSESN